MCGIVGYAGKKSKCVPVLLEGLEKLEYRGYDSAGIAFFQNGELKTIKAKGKIRTGLIPLVEQESPVADVGIGHTRWATHGEPSDINSHPLGSGRISIVHNGIIENYRDIKQFLSDNGYTFESETDTETVVKLIDYYYEQVKNPFEAIVCAAHEIEGAYALGIIFRDFPTKVFAVRKDSPLIVGSTENTGGGAAYIASDVAAIISHTKDYYLLEHGEIAELDTSGSIKFTSFHGTEIHKKLEHVDWDSEAAQKGGYEHFMLKEIYEQPAAIKNTLSPRIKNGIPDFSECGLTPDMLRKYRHIYLIGCGTAMHAGIIGKYVIESMSRTPVIVDIASEFRYRSPLLAKDDLVVIISQSGETADTLAALNLANSTGADTLAVVNVAGSSIARKAKMVLLTLAGPEISVCSTKAYMVQCVFMYLFALALSLAHGTITREKCVEYVGKLTQIPQTVEKVLSDITVYQQVASRLIKTDSLLYIGRGLDYALSMEGSLKLKEISYIHSESYAAGELKHGTISLIEKGMPVIAIATQPDLFDKTASNIREVQSRGAMVVAVCTEGREIPDADFIVTLPYTDAILTPLVAVVPLQLIAYYTAALRGNDVDRPRNLAKSVTVE
ncbi:glutamine--fructose-6-phosphate aminotransferase [isomerizing] [Clostridia bacterium]|nr:glutamine--fructose-6-phosphate aminotransferase [isomerizing] [Clostridia bacterium]